jgi:hypothetical protein
MLLEDAFLVRVAAEDCGLSHDGFPEHSSFCYVDRNGACRFRLIDYVNELYEAQVDKSGRAALLAKIEELRNGLKPEPRLQMHGHDARETFGWYIRRHKGYAHLHEKTISSMLLAFIDFSYLATPALLEIAQRLSKPRGREEMSS